MMRGPRGPGATVLAAGPAGEFMMNGSARSGIRCMMMRGGTSRAMYLTAAMTRLLHEIAHPGHAELLTSTPEQSLWFFTEVLGRKDRMHAG